jgi:hypothetical protein
MTPVDPVFPDVSASVGRQIRRRAGLGPAYDPRSTPSPPPPVDLDSALRNLDEAAAAKEAQTKKRTADNVVQRQRFQALVDDFRRRMAALGNPGMDWEMKEGRFSRKVRGWSFYIDPDSLRGLPVTEDGRIPSFVRDRPGEYVRPIDSQFTPSDDVLQRLTFSMAELVRRHRG